MKEARKLAVTGDYTYMVTLPKAWVKRLGWRAKQMLELEIKKNSIVVRDFENTRR
jgi:bifunctional DNA-binding transcriptional regulator/antitoxin component of YhaV-PrlF toxin-antitoxin module